MPRVPTYDNFEVGQTVNPNQGFQSGISPEAAALPGKQLQQLGGSMLSAGSEEAKVVIDMQKEANSLRVDDALNKAKERALDLMYNKDTGLVNQKGIAALERASGKPLADEYAEVYKKDLSDIYGGLGNDAQRQAFQVRANDLGAQLYGVAVKHEAEQFKEYALSVREGTIANSLNSIGLNWNNPSIVDKETDTIKAAAAEQGRLLGKSATWIEANTRKLLSNAHLVAIGAAIEKEDIGFAEAYLSKYSKDMDANDILKVRGLIGKQIDQSQVATTVNNAISGVVTKFKTPDGDRAFNILVGTESNGQMFGKDGMALTSPKGAIGIAQVMPTTGPEAAKLAGLPWDEQKFRTDKNYNLALGRAYFEKQLKDYNGNLDQAYAAYNAGAGAVNLAIEKASKLGGTYLQYLPEETQKYVTKNMAEYSAGKGTYDKPTLKEVLDAVDAQLPNASFQVKSAAREEAARQFKLIEADTKSRDDAATNAALQSLLSNGGNYNALPISVRGSVPPKDLEKVLDFAKKVANGDRKTDLALYQKLTDPVYLNGLSDQEFFRTQMDLSDSDWKRFANQRAIVKSGKGANGAGDIPSGSINTAVSNSLRMINIDPTPKESDTAEVLRIGAIKKFVTDSIMEQQLAHGKKFTDVEVEKQVNALFAKNLKFRSTFLGYSYGDTQNIPMLSLKVGDIPSDVKDSLKLDLKLQGVDNPSDGQLLNKYFNFLKQRQRALGY